MGLYEFKMLSEKEQYDLVFTKGDFADVLVQGGTRYVLYSLFKFWVEVTYNTETNEIIGLQTFIDGHLLDKFSNI